MNSVYKMLDRTTSVRGMNILLVALAVVGGCIAYAVGQIQTLSGQGILDFETGHTRERVLEILGSYTPEAFQWYARIQLLDLVNPFLYSWLLASVIHLLVKDRRFTWLVIVPLGAGLLDYIENYYLYVCVSSFPDIDAGQVASANQLSLIKRGVLFAGIAALFGAIAIRLFVSKSKA